MVTRLSTQTRLTKTLKMQSIMLLMRHFWKQKLQKLSKKNKKLRKNHNKLILLSRKLHKLIQFLLQNLLRLLNPKSKSIQKSKKSSNLAIFRKKTSQTGENCRKLRVFTKNKRRKRNLCVKNSLSTSKNLLRHQITMNCGNSEQFLTFKAIQNSKTSTMRL